MIQRAHKLFSLLAMSLIVGFFCSTLVVELMGDPGVIYQVKNAIFYAIWLLVVAMAATGITGVRMAGKRRGGLIGNKKKRMPLVALNGLLILIPSAIYLRSLAAAGDIGTVFYLIQTLELLAGAVNISLMALNIRDGLKIAAASQQAVAAGTSSHTGQPG
tara:strand:+ start:4930 stop:5409 length:480 start_codon:yes stop_codon:yes gene_type:complete